MVQRALAAIADRALRRAETGLYDPHEARAADALVELAEAGRVVGDPAPATLVVHVEAGPRPRSCRRRPPAGCRVCWNGVAGFGGRRVGEVTS